MCLSCDKQNFIYLSGTCEIGSVVNVCDSKCENVVTTF